MSEAYLTQQETLAKFSHTIADIMERTSRSWMRPWNGDILALLAGIFTALAILAQATCEERLERYGRDS